MLQHHIRHGRTVRCGSLRDLLRGIWEGIPIPTEQFQPDFCRIPPYRNFCCRFYSNCLTAHALRDSTGFTCDGCDYENDREPVNPWEVLGVVHLLAVVFRHDLPGLVADLNHGRTLTVRTPGRVWVQAQ